MADQVYIPEGALDKGGQFNWRKDRGKRIKLSAVSGITAKGVLKQDFRFQCPPLETVNIDWGASSHVDYDTVKRGQFSRKQGRRLKSVNFTTLFVEYGTYVVADGLWNTQKLIDHLRKIGESGTPFWFAMGDDLPRKIELEMKATLRVNTTEERAGEPDARYVTVEFHEWREAGNRRRSRTHDAKFPKHHKLEGNDTLQSLAKKYYGRPSGARHIGRANKGLEKVGVTYLIAVSPKWDLGDKITIPKPPQRNNDPRYHPTNDHDQALLQRDAERDEFYDD